MTRSPWQFDLTHSSLEFSVRHMLVSKVRGRFARWSGALWFEEDRPEAAALEVEIETASVTTGHEERDAHLRSADFLDAARFPKMRFHSTAVTRLCDRSYGVAGELILRGVTRPVALEVELIGRMIDPWHNERAGFTAKGSLDRKDYGMVFNQCLDHGGLALGDRVDISIDVAVVRSAVETTARAASGR